MLRLLQGSELVSCEPARVQDAYTLRCIPQVHGATFDALEYIRSVLEIEINAATDNPLVFPESGEVISCGNFHGSRCSRPRSSAIAVNELGNISERRIERLVNPALNNGLPAFLTENGGLNSGLMLLQHAAAALVSRARSHPTRVPWIPSPHRAIRRSAEHGFDLSIQGPAGGGEYFLGNCSRAACSRPGNAVHRTPPR